MIETPADWMDLADWDRYWSEVLADELYTRLDMMTLLFRHTSLRYLQGLERRAGHHILLAGNGISPEPHGFVHAGCDVTVVDVSPAACRFVAAMEVTPDLLANMYTVLVMGTALDGWTVQMPDREKSLALAAEEHRAGGCLSIVTADLFAYEPEQPFHAIFSRRAYQGLPPGRREELARRFYRWLQPDGLAFVEMINIRPREQRELFEAPFLAAGFRKAEPWPQASSGE